MLYALAQRVGREESKDFIGLVMNKLKTLKESLAVNGRKPISKLSMHLFNEEQKKVKARALRESSGKALKESVNEDFNNNGLASFILDVMYMVEDSGHEDVRDNGEFATFDFYADSVEDLKSQVIKKLRSLGCEGVKNLSDERLFSHAVDPNNNGWILINPSEYKRLHFNNIVDDEEVSLRISLRVDNKQSDRWEQVGEDVSLDEIFTPSVNESQKRRPVKESQSRSASAAQQRLQENLTRPISGMEYRVFKQGNEGMGNGKVITQGIATARKDYAIVNGEKFDYNKYAFVGTKGF